MRNQGLNRRTAAAQAHPFTVLLHELERAQAPLAPRFSCRHGRRRPRSCARRHRRGSRGALRAEACPEPGSLTSRDGRHPEQSTRRQDGSQVSCHAHRCSFFLGARASPRPLPWALEMFMWSLLGPSDVSLPAPPSQRVTLTSL